MTENALSRAFQQWEQALQALQERLEKLEQQGAHFDQLEQRLAALEQRLSPPKPQPSAPVLTSPAASAMSMLSVDTKLRLGLPPPVRARVARWLAEHGLNEQTCRTWVDMPLEDLHATLFYAKQRAEDFPRPGRILHRCSNPDCPCQNFPDLLPIRSSPLEEADDGLPLPIRSHVARWLVRHGCNYNTVMSVGWRLMPLDPRGALRFARDRIAAPYGGAARARGVYLHPCANLKCVCHEVLAE